MLPSHLLKVISTASKKVSGLGSFSPLFLKSHVQEYLIELLNQNRLKYALDHYEITLLQDQSI